MPTSSGGTTNAIVSNPELMDIFRASPGVRQERTRWKKQFQGMPPSVSMNATSHQFQTPGTVQAPARAPMGGSSAAPWGRATA
jgi:hypothetical protein